MTKRDRSGRSAPFETVDSRVVWSCPWFSVRRDEILLPNGQAGVYNVVQHPGAVWTVSPMRCHAYLATGVVQGPTGHEPAELLEVHPTPVEEALDVSHIAEEAYFEAVETYRRRIMNGNWLRILRSALQ